MLDEWLHGITRRFVRRNIWGRGPWVETMFVCGEKHGAERFFFCNGVPHMTITYRRGTFVAITTHHDDYGH